MPETRWGKVLDTDDLYDGDTVRLKGSNPELHVRIDEDRPGDPIRLKDDYAGDQNSNVFYDRSVRRLVQLGLLEKKMPMEPGQVWVQREASGPHNLYWLVDSNNHAIRLNKLAAGHTTLRQENSWAIPSGAELLFRMTPETA